VRKAILVVHILVNAAWLGAVLAMLLLVTRSRVEADLAAFALNDVAIWTSLLVLFTSMCFALFTPWGFFKFRWVTTKWLALFLLALLAVFLRTPAVNSLAATADVQQTIGARSNAIAWLVVEVLALCAVFALSVWKPWGRTHNKLEPGPKLRVVIASLAVVISGFAIAQSVYLAGLRRTPIDNVDARSLRSGIYEGRADVGVTARVRVKVESGQLMSVDVVELPRGHYLDLARGVTTKMLREQRVDVDGVTGATTTSRAIQKATANALATR
jgi:uncharacterized protein with FMN-binding domain